VNGIPVTAGWLLAAALMTVGLVGVLRRRNLLFILLAVELMFNAAALAFIVAGAQCEQPDGEVMFVFVLAISAAEAAVGMALLLCYYRCFGTLDVGAATTLKD
jgi:NADH-quinone oxidoreductase subunit K